MGTASTQRGSLVDIHRSVGPCPTEPRSTRSAKPAPAPAGLYVHVPFCSGKCAYCDFYSVPADPDRIERWLRALAREAALFTEVFPVFDTLYLGGGTPSVLRETDLARLLDTLARTFRFAPAPEITLEANPDDATPERLAAWRARGVNRLSLGVQSLDDRQLALLGRRHTAAQSVRAMERVRGAGLESWSADLMFGLPGQTPDDLQTELERVVSFQPDHLSCYQLTLAAGTPLQERHARGQLALPGEEREAELFLAVSRCLEARGYRHYEVSNFAGRPRGLLSSPQPVPPPDRESPRGPGAGRQGAPEADETPASAARERWCTCRHNEKYWSRAPYLGLGPAAHSFRGNERWWNPRSLDRYCEALEAGRCPAEGRETLTPEQERLETLSLALRTRRGMRRETLLTYPGAREQLPRLLREGLLEETDERIAQTPRGFLVADRLPLLFL